MSFLHPTLLWGLLLAGVPVLIHLINMMRHRRVEWAAMEFLLVSQKKNRTWILFKQLLLLLLRMAVVAVLVLAVAQPLFPQQVGHSFWRQHDTPCRAPGRQLLHVRPLGRHQRDGRGQVGHPADRRDGRSAGRATDGSRSCDAPRPAASDATIAPTCFKKRSIASLPTG